MQVLGVSLSYQSSIRISENIQKSQDSILKKSLDEGKRIRFIGDNLNFTKNVAHETIKHHGHMEHMFSSAILINDNMYEDIKIEPEIPLKDLKPTDVWLSQNEYKQIREDTIWLVTQLLPTLIPTLGYLTDSLPKRMYEAQKEFSTKTIPIPLGVRDLNEQYYSDTVQILDGYENQLAQLGVTEKVQIGGDQLTRERFGTAIKLRIGNPNPNDRYDHLGPTTFEFFHLNLNYMDKAMIVPLHDPEGIPELGTLRAEKERVSRNSFDPNVCKF